MVKLEVDKKSREFSLRHDKLLTPYLYTNILYTKVRQFKKKVSKNVKRGVFYIAGLIK